MQRCMHYLPDPENIVSAHRHKGMHTAAPHKISSLPMVPVALWLALNSNDSCQLAFKGAVKTTYSFGSLKKNWRFLLPSALVWQQTVLYSLRNLITKDEI